MKPAVSPASFNDSGANGASGITPMASRANSAGRVMRVPSIQQAACGCSAAKPRAARLVCHPLSASDDEQCHRRNDCDENNDPVGVLDEPHPVMLEPIPTHGTGEDGRSRDRG